MTFTKERIIEELKASTQNASGMFEISEDTICALMSLLTAPPAPVAPAGYRLQPISEYDAMCAAMLQSADGTLTNEDTKRVGELVMWVKRLAHSLRKANPDSKLQKDAMDYLSRNGFIGVEDILR